MGGYGTKSGVLIQGVAFEIALQPELWYFFGDPLNFLIAAKFYMLIISNAAAKGLSL